MSDTGQKRTGEGVGWGAEQPRPDMTERHENGLPVGLYQGGAVKPAIPSEAPLPQTPSGGG